ncbi:MAG: PadR family transcriptional regulator [Bacillota bacterium]|nr:PadR family transcriptional regulator [Bacillota bacterium]
MSLQHAILGLLTYESMSGYDLKSFLDNSINFFWTAQLSQIYRDLGSLESKGYVTYHIEKQEGRPDRKVYSINEEGRGAFTKWLEKFPPTLSSAVRDEFAVRIFFGSRISQDEMSFQLKRFKKEKEEELKSFVYVNKIVEKYSQTLGAPQEEFYWKLLLKRSYMVTNSLIEWADESIQMIENSQIPTSNQENETVS